MTDALQARMQGDVSLEEAVLDLVKETYGANSGVVFGGDNYSADWHVE